MLELLAGLFVALAALALVLEPLARPRDAVGADQGAAGSDDPFTDPRESDSPKVRALVALREIEFDRATGKLSEEDYVRLKAKYEAAAIAAIKTEEREEAGEAGEAGRPHPAAAAAAPATPAATTGSAASRACPRCGPRPEAAPIFCSSCGRSLVVAA